MRKLPFGPFDYSRPGPGVPEKEPERNGFINFFVTLIRKFTQLLKANLIFMVPVIATVLLMYCIYSLPVPRYVFGTDGGGLNLWNMYAVTLPLVFLYPFSSGLCSITRKIVTGEHSFLWDDYRIALKVNFRLFLINGIVIYLFWLVFSFSLYFYSLQFSSGWAAYVPFGILAVLAVVFLMAQFYVPILITCTESKLKDIYKNSLILTILGLKRNILFFVIFSVFVIFTGTAVSGAIGPLAQLLSLVLICLILPVFLIYTDLSMIYPVVRRYVLEPFQRRTNKTDTVEEEGSSSDV